jgi:hypothetical protein
VASPARRHPRTARQLNENVLRFARLHNGLEVITSELGPGQWETLVHSPGEKGFRTARASDNEDEALADHAALCGEFGP